MDASENGVSVIQQRCQIKILLNDWLRYPVKDEINKKSNGVFLPFS
jgi:hypothetical protein